MQEACGNNSLLFLQFQLQDKNNSFLLWQATSEELIYACYLKDGKPSYLMINVIKWVLFKPGFFPHLNYIDNLQVWINVARFNVLLNRFLCANKCAILNTFRTPDTHTINVNMCGKWGPRISMKMAMSLMTSANNLEIKHSNVQTTDMCTCFT